MSFLGSLGKGLLKVGKMAAPAIGMIPGGNFINMGIGAADAAVNKGGIGPSSGGNLGNRNGMSPLAMNYGGGGQNTGPSKPSGNTGISGFARGMQQANPQAQFGRELGQMFGSGEGPQMIQPGIQQNMTSPVGGGGFDWKKLIGPSVAGIGGLLAGKLASRGSQQPDGSTGMWGPQTQSAQPNQYNPDLGPAIAAGRNQAMADMPWRKPLQNFDMNSPIQPFGGQAMPTRATDRNRMRQVAQ